MSIDNDWSKGIPTWAAAVVAVAWCLVIILTVALIVAVG